MVSGHSITPFDSGDAVSDIPALQAGALESSLSAPGPDTATLCETEADGEAEGLSKGRGRALVVILGLLAAAWSGFCVWAHAAEPATPALVAQWVEQWAVALLLLAAVWLIVLRSSTREAARFQAAARVLRAESRALEARLASTNAHLATARAQIDLHTRDLAEVGRTATDQLNRYGENLGALVAANSAHVNTVGEVFAVATANLHVLKDGMPVVINVAKDMSNSIGAVGRQAHGRIDEMVKAMARLTEFGHGIERHVAGLREHIGGSLDALEARTRELEAVIAGRFEALEARSHGFGLDLDKHEADAREALRQRAATLNDEVTATYARLARDEAECLTSLRVRLNALRDESATVGRALRDSETGALAAWQANVAQISAEVAMP